MEFGPKLFMTFVTAPSKPVRMAPTPIMVPVPITTPSMVSILRSLCVRMVSNASSILLRNAKKEIHGLVRLERNNGVELCRLARWINAKKQSNARR